MTRRADFTLLYAAIDDAMRASCDDALASGLIAGDEAVWFSGLRTGFRQSFAAWGSDPTPPGIGAYLAALDRHPRLVRLAGHVFLHIVVDLPMVIRRSFDEHADVDRAVMRAIYLRPAHVLHVDVMRRRVRGEHARRTASIVAGRSLTSLAHWVQTMRATSWVHAELAHDARLGPGRVEAALVAALHAALRSLDEAPRDSTAPSGALGRRIARLRSAASTIVGSHRTIERFGREVHRRAAAAMLAELVAHRRAGG